MFVLFCPPPGSPSRTGNAKLSLHQLRGLDGEKLNSSALAGDDGWSQTESRLMVNKQNGALTEFVHFKPDNHNYNPPLLFPSVTRRRMGRNWKKLDTRRPKKQKRKTAHQGYLECWQLCRVPPSWKLDENAAALDYQSTTLGTGCRFWMSLIYTEWEINASLKYLSAARAERQLCYAPLKAFFKASPAEYGAM